MSSSGNSDVPKGLISPPYNDDQFIKWLKYFEGYYEYFYVDTKGLVTIGTGLMYESADVAVSGHPQEDKLEFYSKDAITPLRGDELIKAVKKDFTMVKDMHLAAGMGTEKKTTIRATTESLDKVFKTRLETATEGARKYFEIDDSLSILYTRPYKYFYQLPISVQYALIDMDYNLGTGGQNKKTKKYSGLMQYRTLRKTLKTGDWDKAAGECHRKGPSAYRNNQIAKWIKWNSYKVIAPVYNCVNYFDL